MILKSIVSIYKINEDNPPCVILDTINKGKFKPQDLLQAIIWNHTANPEKPNKNEIRYIFLTFATDVVTSQSIVKILNIDANAILNSAID